MAGAGSSPIGNGDIIRRLKLGLLLKSMREESGKSQRDSSAAIGYANATFVCNVEKGTNNIPIGKVMDFAREYAPSESFMLAAAILRFALPETWDTCMAFLPGLLASNKNGRTLSKEVDVWIEKKFMLYDITFN